MRRPNLGGLAMTSRPSPLTVVEKGKEAVAASASFGNQAAWAAAPHAFLGNSQGSGPACLGIPRFGGSSSAVVNQRTGDGSSGQEAARVRPRGAGSDAAGARACSGGAGAFAAAPLPACGDRVEMPCSERRRRPSASRPWWAGCLVGRAGAKLNLLDVQDVAPVGFVP